MTRHFLRDDDLSPDELIEVLDLADELKADRFSRRPLAGPRAVAVIFDKPSTRTRVSFSVGIAELGGYPLIIESKVSQLARGAPNDDTARDLERQVACLVWRTFEHDRLTALAAASSVPVVNGLTDQFHPCQILADLQTIRQHRGALAGLTVSYVGDTSNNMGNSYLLGSAAAGIHIRIGGPAGYSPDPVIVDQARALAAGAGGSVLITSDPVAAVDGADVLITDTWVSMGHELDQAGREDLLRPFSITARTLERAAPGAIVLHCQPAYRGKEISAEVLDGPQSVVWDEAENRLHAQKALLTWLLERS
ncbi:MAG: ornithine carbamoyltransferase [Pseudonocardiales bacterium]|nr:ornithine carbamoyltransferase [Pseudonocardiales bacterium]